MEILLISRGFSDKNCNLGIMSNEPPIIGSLQEACMHASHILDKLQPGYSYPKLLHFSQTIHLKTDGYFHPTEAHVCSALLS